MSFNSLMKGGTGKISCSEARENRADGISTLKCYRETTWLTTRRRLAVFVFFLSVFSVSLASFLVYLIFFLYLSFPPLVPFRMTRLTDKSERRKEHGNGETVKMRTKENKGKEEMEKEG